MKSEQGSSKKISKAWIKPLIIMIGLGFLLFTLWSSIPAFKSLIKRNPTIITSSTLIKMVDISELYTSEFRYKGVADIDKEIAGKKCEVKYSAVVRTSIDMSKIDFSVDDESKTVTPVIPKMKIDNVTIDSDLSFIPESVDVDLAPVIKACEEDALNEAKQQPKLFSTAEDSLHTTIESLLNPIINSQGYKVVWN